MAATGLSATLDGMANLSYATGWRKYLWLAAGIALAVAGTNGEWAIPLAGWVFSLAMMRFARSSGVWIGSAGVVLGYCVATVVLVAASGSLTVPPILVGCVLLSLLLSVPLLADRLLCTRLPVFAATLVFPATRVALEFLLATFSPLGTVFGPLATVQSTNLPLLQLVSVTGVYGISFLMAWAAPVVNAVLERRAWRAVAAAYVAVLGLVLFGGSLRLALAPSPQTVRVAGISVSRDAEQRMHGLNNFHTPTLTPEQKPVLRKAFAELTDDLFARTRREADAGARILAWPEAAGVVLDDDYPEFLRTARELAVDKHIYLDLGLAVVQAGDPPTRDIAVLVTPDGQIESTYDKAHPVPGMENLRPGDGRVPVAASPYGRLGHLICFDADFPRTARARADIVFVPSNDWPGVARTHAADTVFRAVENGYGILRQTSNGIAIAVDAYGTPLARSDYFASTEHSMVVSMPTRGTRTIYGMVGDVFAWLCVAGAAGLAAAGVLRSSRS
ncbi:nitrilase-related carbon-nitrogen hydrolase [Nocardia panacis]|nr:nitrilase-related carbon-nitrogen hydrolase [Nocardia panacis]